MAELRQSPIPISPELCLVDPELAAWARLRGEDRPRYAPVVPAPVAVAKRSTFRARAALLAVTALALGVALSVSTLTGRRVSLANHAAPGGRTELAWRPVPGARGYDVILWRGGERVLDLWPSAAHVTLPARWRHHGAVLTPGSGRLLWFVYPVLARSPRTIFGPLAASGQLQS